MYTKREEKKKYKTLYIEERVINELKDLSKKNNISANKMLIQMVEYCLKNKEWLRSEKDI